MDWGNVAEWAAIVVSLVGAGAAGVWIAGRFGSRMDVQDSRISAHGKRLDRLESQTATLADKLDDIKETMLKGFAEIKVALANKQDRD